MWLDAFTDTQATLYTFPNCVVTADLVGDGDYRLIIADIGSGNVPSKLKVSKTKQEGNVTFLNFVLPIQVSGVSYHDDLS